MLAGRGFGEREGCTARIDPSAERVGWFDREQTSKRSTRILAQWNGSCCVALVRAGEVRIGISGWRYRPWRGVFYPADLPQKRELYFASRAMKTIELNGSFYSLQSPSSYSSWYRETPADFVFAVKGGRFLTHNKKLRDCGLPLANFLASGVLALEEKLGPILWQLPPQLRFDAQRLEDFFAILPRSTMTAADIASRHDARIKRGAYLEVKEDRRLRYAVEVRHESYDDPAFVKILRAHDIALAVADTAGKFPYLEDVTSDFVYVRLHGSKRLYVSGYDAAGLDRWSTRVLAWRDGGQPSDAILAAPNSTPRPRKGRDVYVYFDNDVKVRAPFDAMNLAARVGHGKRKAFPRKALRLAEAARGVEEPLSNWDRWRFERSQPR
jgi:uncharacterized protein YecE (DUF72 family)